MNARFHLPGITSHFKFNLVFAEVLKQYPQYFRDGVEIASVYGTFPPCIWNGGRTQEGICDKRFIKTAINAFNERGIPLRFTFTNPALEKKHLGDKMCNMVMALANNGLNEVIVNSPLLEDYIRKNYPKYKLTSSTCKRLDDGERLAAELEKDYKLVVLDYNWNNDFERLEKIPREYRARCEILIDPYCTPHCKRRGAHYKALGAAQRESAEAPLTAKLRGTNTMQKAMDFKCENMGYNFYQIQQFSTFVGLEQIQKYLEMGFNNFKLEGRVLSPYNVLESYMYYMVKPEFRDEARMMFYYNLEQNGIVRIDG